MRSTVSVRYIWRSRFRRPGCCDVIYLWKGSTVEAGCMIQVFVPTWDGRRAGRQAGIANLDRTVK